LKPAPKTLEASGAGIQGIGRKAGREVTSLVTILILTLTVVLALGFGTILGYGIITGILNAFAGGSRQATPAPVLVSQHSSGD